MSNVMQERVFWTYVDRKGPYQPAHPKITSIFFFWLHET